MKVYELSRKLGTDNKTLITFFKDNEFKVASHNQNLTDEQVTFAKKNFDAKKYQEPKVEIDDELEEDIKVPVKKEVPVRELRKFNMDDMIGMAVYAILAVGGLVLARKTMNDLAETSV